MPLSKGKSKAAFSHNVGAEMNAGKPQKQALAIAYSMKRKAKKGYAQGGEVKADEEEMEHGTSKEHFLSAEEDMEPPFESEPMSDSDELAENDNEVHSTMDNEEGHDEPEFNRQDIVSSILRSIRMKHMGRK